MREPGTCSIASKVVNLWSVNLIRQQNDLTRTCDYTYAFTVTLSYKLQIPWTTFILLQNGSVAH